MELAIELPVLERNAAPYALFAVKVELTITLPLAADT